MDTSRLDQYITKHLRESMLDLYRLAKIPSFAAHPESSGGMCPDDFRSVEKTWV